MSLREKVSFFWNVTLGVDIPEVEDIETSNNPELAELKESLQRVENLTENFKKSTSGGKGKSEKSKDLETENLNSEKTTKRGKANSEKSEFIEAVVVNPEALKKANEIAVNKKETTNKEIEK